MIAFKGGYSVEIWDGLSPVSVLREPIQAVSKYPRARIQATAKIHWFEFLVTCDKPQTHARAHIARRRRISLPEGKYRSRSEYRCTKGAIYRCTAGAISLMEELLGLINGLAGQVHAKLLENVFVDMGEDDRGVCFAAAQLAKLVHGKLCHRVGRGAD